ncbi:MAG: DNA-binding protein [Anaeroplasmataceae bacterium]|nr:DNA-binding protein [Anaeroplasmataceae bacterium]
MTFEKREEIISLYDAYSLLLTEKQRQYFESYYFDDLSITEISSNFEVSRNAVFDQLKRVNQILVEYEEKLHLIEKMKKIEHLEISSKLKEEIRNILKE